MYGGRLEMKKISRKTACLIITALLVVIGIGTYFCKSTYAKNTTMIPKSLEIKKGKSMKISVKKEKIKSSGVLIGKMLLQSAKRELLLPKMLAMRK